MLAILVFCLGVVVAYKVAVGEGTADFLNSVAGDPNLVLPPSVTSQDAGPLPPDIGVVTPDE